MKIKKIEIHEIKITGRRLVRYGHNRWYEWIDITEDECGLFVIDSAERVYVLEKLFQQAFPDLI